MMRGISSFGCPWAIKVRKSAGSRFGMAYDGTRNSGAPAIMRLIHAINNVRHTAAMFRSPQREQTVFTHRSR
jgi:hypothetical protein